LIMKLMCHRFGVAAVVAVLGWGFGSVHGAVPAFLETHCVECHDAETKKGGLDLEHLHRAALDVDAIASWIKVFDRIETGEMPPQKKSRPEVSAKAAYLKELGGRILTAERGVALGAERRGLRRLTRSEYEHTVRDLFAMPGVLLQSMLPSDGTAHGFDKNADALDISHVNLAKYVEAADHVLDLAIATRPEAPPVERVRLSLAGNYQANIMLMGGDAMLMKHGAVHPVVPPAGVYPHVDQGSHERLGLLDGKDASVAVFRHEDDSWNAYFQRFASIYPGMYRVRASFWSMQWDKGNVRPSRGTEAARLSIVHFNENGRGGGHPSTVLGYFDAPSLVPMEHGFEVWLNPRESFGFNTASLAHVVLYRVGTWGQVDRTMGYTGPCVVNDWLEVEGPIHAVWPPVSHRALFGEGRLEKFDPKAKGGPRMPVRKAEKQEIIGARNRPDGVGVHWTVVAKNPEAEGRELLKGFLPKLFRRPVPAEVVEGYVGRLRERIAAGDGFELAMRSVYRAAMCAPDFLYHVEPEGELDGAALACRLSYFLWNSLPDAELMAVGMRGGLGEAEEVRRQVDRMLSDRRSDRFVEDFLGQWLKLRAIGANDPDKKLYPEFSPYLQDSMVAETRAYFRELLDKDLDASHLVASNFLMVNDKLAAIYGLEGVDGPQIRRVELAEGHVRGGFLTQASLLKITSNGTTTSPVPRGAFVMARLLGRPPQAPPADVPAVEPDVRGATTIRELLDRHRNDSNCAGCHASIDPAGFALEAFDVLGNFRDRYRSLDEGDAAPRGRIDSKIGISFKLGPRVDAAGKWLDGSGFEDVRGLRQRLVLERRVLLRNLASQFAVYGMGRPLSFADRETMRGLLERVDEKEGGVRTLLRELCASELFRTH
jgi:mono/diheme cytochrome c family protein